ncbi:hypothetical protein ACS0TY_009766 [Phlomoides rotata]
MDLWVIAAAAGAGYVAKNLQNLSADKREGLVGNSLKYSYDVQSESRNFLQQFRDKTCPLRRLAQQRNEDNVFLDVDINSLEERLEFEDGGNRTFSRGKLVKDGRCVHPIRPLNSLGSCVENMEQSASVSPVRPVLVTDGRWGNTSSCVDFDGCREEAKRENAASSSSSSSKQFESVEELRKSKKSSSDLQQNGYRDARSPHSQGPETMLLFITGMTIGILSATWSWKKEVDKLNKQLNQMDSLVQDLHEELDMKEMIMVKELQTDEGVLPSASISSPVEIFDESNKFYSLNTNEKNAENLELLSRIEEELQAELEMLEQNMKVSAVERLSSVVEIDPDFEPEIVRGDLKATMVNDASESGTETTDTTTNCSKPANYAVSPRELSLRLHELLESRLEARIKELEIELGNRQNMISGKRFSYSETESSSTHQSPTCICSAHDILPEEASTYKGNKGILLKLIDKEEEKEDGEHDSISHHGVVMEEDRSETLVQDMQQFWDKQRGMSFMYNEDSTSEDEGSDESDMLLIKQIVERRKSGSNFNLRID